MRFESSVTSITWLPADTAAALPKEPFDTGGIEADEPPPDTLEDLDELRKAGGFRLAQTLRAWVEADDNGKIVDWGQEGESLAGEGDAVLRGGDLGFPASPFPALQADPVVHPGKKWVRFVQTGGGRLGLPAARRLEARAYPRIASAAAWTTVSLVLEADGTAKAALVASSPFPSHALYDADGTLLEQTEAADIESWLSDPAAVQTPWGDEDSAALVPEVESDLENRLAASILRKGAELGRRKVEPGEALVEQGQEGEDLFLLLDGVLRVEVDDRPVAEVGPGAVLGERALLEGGKRTATLRALTPVRVAVVPREAVDESVLPALAELHRREET